MNSDRDRFPSYLREALELIEHYIDYQGRTAIDLIALENVLSDLQRKIAKSPVYPELDKQRVHPLVQRIINDARDAGLTK